MKHNSIKILLGLVLTSVSTFSFAQNVGVNTALPNSRLHVAATAADSVALKVSVNNNTKLKVAANGGTSIGTAVTAPANGLLVAGVLQPEDSIRSATQPIYIASVNDSVVLQAGGTTIILLATGAVKIIARNAGGISIDAGSGNVNITGANVNIKATGGTATLAGVATVVEGSANTRISGPLVRLGSASGGGLPAARLGDTITGGSTSGGAVTGTITTGSSVVLIQ